MSVYVVLFTCLLGFPAHPLVDALTPNVALVIAIQVPRVVVSFVELGAKTGQRERYDLWQCGTGVPKQDGSGVLGDSDQLPCTARQLTIFLPDVDVGAH